MATTWANSAITVTCKATLWTIGVQRAARAEEKTRGLKISTCACGRCH